VALNILSGSCARGTTWRAELPWRRRWSVSQARSLWGLGLSVRPGRLGMAWVAVRLSEQLHQESR